MGSDSDWPVMQQCYQQLTRFAVSAHVEVMSAHRSPQRVHEFASTAEANGIEVIIAGAGMSAALAGTIAAVTPLPVIGVPLANGMLDGLDALLSTAQMPPGVPVAAMGPGSAGARNAALLAVQILAATDEQLARAFREYKSKQASEVAAKNQSLQERLEL